MKVKNIEHKLRVGLIWNVSGTIISKVIVMITAILTARILGADKNGEFGIINNTVGMFSTFAVLGLGTTATRFIAEFKEDERERCGNIIALAMAFALISSVLFAAVLIFKGEWLARTTLNNEELTMGLSLSSIMMVFNTLNTVQNSILSGFEDFKSIAKISVIQGIISFPIFLVFTYLLGVNGLVIGYGIVGSISFFVARFKIISLCKRYSINVLYKNCLKEYKIFFKFALPSMLMNVLVIPVTWLGNTIIIQDELGYYNLGVFNAANQWRTAITLLPTAIGNVILPYIISNDDEKIENINILLSWVIVTILSSGVMCISNVIAWFYGNSYPAEILKQAIIIICLMCELLSFKEGIARNLVKHSYMWFGFFSNLLWGVCFIVGIIMLREKGVVGIALAYLVSYFVTTIIFVPYYITKGIVKKQYLLDRKILLLWTAYIFQTILFFFEYSIVLRIASVVLGMFILYYICKVYFEVDNVFLKLRRKLRRER